MPYPNESVDRKHQRLLSDRTKCPKTSKGNTLPEPKQYPETPGDKRTARRTQTQCGSRRPRELVDSGGEFIKEQGEPCGPGDVEEAFCGVPLEEMSRYGGMDVFDSHGRQDEVGALLAFFVLRAVPDEPGENLGCLRSTSRRVAFGRFWGGSFSHVGEEWMPQGVRRREGQGLSERRGQNAYDARGSGSYIVGACQPLSDR